jgi:hypothetical protein
MLPEERQPMRETSKQYTKRVLGYLKGNDPLAVLASSPRKAAALVAGVSKRRLARRPQPQQWSVTEILAHLADTEMVYGFRLRLILGANGLPIQGFDQDAWARFYAQQDPALSLEAWRLDRERTVRLLRGLAPKDWKRFGVHSERGRETLRRVVELMAGHDLNHLRQVRAILAGR